MVASTRAAPLATQTPSAAAEDDRDEPLGDRRLLEARLAESHQGVFKNFPTRPTDKAYKLKLVLVLVRPTPTTVHSHRDHYVNDPTLVTTN